jgi:flagellar hook-basal body complex protein FliE
MATMPINPMGDLVQLARTNPLHYTANGKVGPLGGQEGGQDPASFEKAMLKALDGVNADQQTSNSLIEQMLVDPESVDVHQVTVAMAEASLPLTLAKTLLSRVVTAWKDVINTR